MDMRVNKYRKVCICGVIAPLRRSLRVFLRKVILQDFGAKTRQTVGVVRPDEFDQLLPDLAPEVKGIAGIPGAHQGPQFNRALSGVGHVKAPCVSVPELRVGQDAPQFFPDAEKVKDISGKRTEKYRVDLLKVSAATFGYVDKTTNPGYRLFIDSVEGSIKNFSNHLEEGAATVEFTGKFMGTGDTRVKGTFRPEKKSPDFDINVAIENTDMVSMSDLFRSYGDFDIKSGSFSFFSELTIRDDRVDGYVKPLFKDMKVTDRRPSKQKSLFHKIYVGLVGGIAKLLENRPHEEVATKANISGPISSPHTSTWQVIGNLIRNAFIKSILPGFEKEVASLVPS